MYIFLGVQKIKCVEYLRDRLTQRIYGRYLEEIVSMKKNQCSCSASEDVEEGKKKKLKLEADIANE